MVWAFQLAQTPAKSDTDCSDIQKNKQKLVPLPCVIVSLISFLIKLSITELPVFNNYIDCFFQVILQCSVHLTNCQAPY